MASTRKNYPSFIKHPQETQKNIQKNNLFLVCKISPAKSKVCNSPIRILVRKRRKKSYTTSFLKCELGYCFFKMLQSYLIWQFSGKTKDRPKLDSNTWADL